MQKYTYISVCVVCDLSLWNDVQKLWCYGVLYFVICGNDKQKRILEHCVAVTSTVPLPAQVSSLTHPIYNACMVVNVVLSWASEHIPVSALIDSGAAGNLINREVAERCVIPLTPVQPPLMLKALAIGKWICHPFHKKPAPAYWTFSLGTDIFSSHKLTKGIHSRLSLAR